MPALKSKRMFPFKRLLSATVVVAIALVIVPASAFAQTDEIQVYDGLIAPPGVVNLTLHNNFTPDGLNTPAFRGGLTPNQSFNGVAEWAYGVTNWFEAGLYLPLYSISENRGATINGGKIRLLFTAPHADHRTFFYAMNFEFSYNSQALGSENLHIRDSPYPWASPASVGHHRESDFRQLLCRRIQEPRLRAGDARRLQSFPPMGRVTGVAIGVMAWSK